MTYFLDESARPHNVRQMRNFDYHNYDYNKFLQNRNKFYRGRDSPQSLLRQLKRSCIQENKVSSSSKENTKNCNNDANKPNNQYSVPRVVSVETLSSEKSSINEPNTSGHSLEREKSNSNKNLNNSFGKRSKYILFK